MYDWHESFSTLERAQKFITEFPFPWMGLGFYTTDKDTVLITVVDESGERSSGTLPTKEDTYIINIYVFGMPFRNTVFATTPRTAYDART